jgi:hypothetical protein
MASYHKNFQFQGSIFFGNACYNHCEKTIPSTQHSPKAEISSELENIPNLYYPWELWGQGIQ